jgi:hypothetical protein
MAELLYRTLKKINVRFVQSDNTFYGDYGDIADFAAEAVTALTALEVINGFENGNFAPYETLTRAQAAKAVYVSTQLKTAPAPSANDKVLKVFDEPENIPEIKPEYRSPSFQDFMGVCGSGDMTSVGGLKWGRYDFYWSDIEPERGQYSDAALERYGRLVLDAAEKGVAILPILAYSTYWAAESKPYSYEYGGYTYEFGEADTGNKSIWTRERVKKDKDGKIVSEGEVKQDVSKIPVSKQRVADWERYVDKIVSTFSREPYNLKYFQIWNEAHPNSGFYLGGFESYFENLHNPAAKIIRDYGCKAVYGGWPVCGSIDEYIAVLDKYGGFASSDVLDIHYFGLNAIDKLYKAAVERGTEAPAIWQTEMGFTGDKKFIAANLPKMYYYALLNKTGDIDRFKQFYYTWWSPDAADAYGYGMTVFSGNTLSEHGKALKALSEALSGGDTDIFSDVVISPDLSFNINGQSAQSFKVGNEKVVSSFNITDKKSFGKTLTLKYSGLGKVSGAYRMDMSGNKEAVKWSNDNGLTVLTVNTDGGREADRLNENQADFYVILELEEAK